MKRPKISVITCTYNSNEDFLERSLKSLKNQTFKDIEHIIFDGYSNKKVVNVLKDYQKHNSKNYPIKFIQSKPKGVANALNKAAKHATGEIIHFLHDDDFYKDKNSLKRAISYFDKDTNWITGNFVFLFKGKEHFVPITKLLKINPKLILSIFIAMSHENTFMKTDLLEKYGGFNEEVKGPVEYRLWLRMVKKEKLKTVDDVFTIFTIHPGSTSRGGIKPIFRSIKECFIIQRQERAISFWNDIIRNGNFGQRDSNRKRIKDSRDRQDLP